MLNMRPRSGYEIKQFADSSTRFFWAASYGQIYPELRRLEEQGLISGADEANGDRRRRVYRIEPAGRTQLLAWLSTPGGVLELRDEDLLKLFFADALEPAGALALVRGMRASAAERLARLEEVREHAAKAGAGRAPHRFPSLVLQYGLDLHAWVVSWCEEVEARLAAAGPDDALHTPALTLTTPAEEA
jgi:DNA-binding PadR family transcriptional regulator